MVMVMVMVMVVVVVVMVVMHEKGELQPLLDSVAEAEEPDAPAP